MRKIFIILFLLLAQFVFSQDIASEKISILEKKLAQIKTKQDSINKLIEDYKLQSIRYQLKTIGLPKLEKGEKLIEHSAMMLVYSEKYEQAKWVAHIILPDIKDGNFGRTNDFRPDNKISTGSSVEKDYFIKTMLPDSTYKYDGFGFDRGHLAPSADFRWSKKALSESYLYSNMSPQVAELNRQGMADLENLLRTYVIANNTPLFVVTGPILNDSLKKIERGVNKVSIPKKFFKIALDYKHKKAIAFILPNSQLSSPIISYTHCIDEVENITGIDFFANINDSLEETLEKQNIPKDWMAGRQKFDVAPLRDNQLPKHCINTIQAYEYMDKGRTVTVCGTVSSTKKTKKGHIFINLDKSFPNQIFTITIWSSNAMNFSYAPEKYLMSKKVCVTGKVQNNKGLPSMDIKNEKEIKILP